MNWALSKVSKIELMLEKVFASYGIPGELRTSDDLPFQSQDFKDCLNVLGIRHGRLPLSWNHTNGEGSLFKRALSRALRIGDQYGEDAKDYLHRFLRAYRQTPHRITERTPIDMLMHRSIWECNQITESPH